MTAEDEVGDGPLGILFAMACDKRGGIANLKRLGSGIGRQERIDILTAQADALDWAIAQLSEAPAHG